MGGFPGPAATEAVAPVGRNATSERRCGRHCLPAAAVKPTSLLDEPLSISFGRSLLVRGSFHLGCGSDSVCIVSSKGDVLQNTQRTHKMFGSGGEVHEILAGKEHSDSNRPALHCWVHTSRLIVHDKPTRSSHRDTPLNFAHAPPSKHVQPAEAHYPTLQQCGTCSNASKPGKKSCPQCGRGVQDANLAQLHPAVPNAAIVIRCAAIVMLTGAPLRRRRPFHFRRPFHRRPPQ